MDLIERKCVRLLAGVRAKTALSDQEHWPRQGGTDGRSLTPETEAETAATETCEFWADSSHSNGTMAGSCVCLCSLCVPTCLRNGLPHLLHPYVQDLPSPVAVFFRMPFSSWPNSLFLFDTFFLLEKLTVADTYIT